ncbi:MAG: porin family protein [Bacteroidia bacterium]
MKQKLLLLALAGTLSCFAQKEIKAGIIAGATYSKLNVIIPLDYKYAPNFMVGITAEKPVANNLSIFANLNYERRTSTVKAPFAVYDEFGLVAVYPDNKITQTISYLSIPVSARYYFGTQKRFCANLGLYADVYLSDKAKSDHSVNHGGGTISTSHGNFTTVTVGINPGVGYSIPLKNNTDILIDLRYNIGLTDAVKNSDTTVNSFILAANYRFNL